MNTSQAHAVLLDGDITVTRRLREQIKGRAIIAADGGIRHADPLGVMPGLWVGDFDSAPVDQQQHYSDVPRQQFSAQKASSDGDLAITAALDAGARDILVVGATGGPRTDHVLFNLAKLVSLAQNTTLTVMATSGTEEIYPLIPGKTLVCDMPEGTIFSLFGFTSLKHVNIRGAQWPLRNVDIAFGTTKTLSNTGLGKFEISIGSGIAIVLAQIEAI